ncbi:MAG: TonB-dependent receptor [Pseudomonadota bacterium]
MKHSRYLAAPSLLALAFAAAPAAAQDASDTDDTDDMRRMGTVNVVAQRTEENILDVPIAVTALDTELLELKQVDTFSDLQFNVPNVNFTKTFFTGTNFQIRGIGSSLTAASADSGVAAHINDIYFQSPRLFETEYFDIERVEVLRGPQGTLFGRNATGGAINVITAKPALEEFSGAVAYQYGNFSSHRVDGHVNVPLGDHAALRVAGIFLDRDGFFETVDPTADFETIDDRSQFSVRASLKIQPVETTEINFVVSYFEEDDSRVRTAKGLCDFDPTAVLGCLPTGLGFEAGNFSATSGGLGMSDIVLGPFAAFPFNTLENNPNPPDFRQVFTNMKPTYFADEFFAQAFLRQDLFDGDLTFNANVGYQETFITSSQRGSPIGAGFVAPPPIVEALLPINSSVFFRDNLIGVSATDPTFAGAIAGNIDTFADGVFSFDQSDADSDQVSFELRLNSNFEGPFNFLIGYYNLDFDGAFDYFVNSNSLDYAAAIFPTLLFADPFGLNPDPFVPDTLDGFAIGAPFFLSETDLFSLDSRGIFGELYWEPTDTLKVTAGVRSTTDDKFLRDRTAPLLALPGIIPVGPAAEQISLDLVNTFAPFREVEVSFDNEFTGRFVVDWSPDLNFTNDTLIYASYSRGFKSGGFNPPVDPNLISGVPETFDPESINAYEIGTKNTLLDGTLQASLAGFFYDYNGLQVGRIQARTSINENVDARIWGLEGEFVWSPVEDLLFNLTASYLNTEITAFESEDPRDPTAGQAGHILIKDRINASNCLLENADPTIFQTALGILQAADPVNLASTPLTDVPGLQSPGLIFTCNAAALDALVATMNALGDTDVASSFGISQDLSGNELQNSPTWSFNIGAQYTFDLPEGYTLIARSDYYIQDSFFASAFNSPTQDFVEGWDVWNAQVTLQPPDQNWYLRGFVQNILDQDEITGQFIGDQSTALNTSIFLLDPRLYGVEIGVTF